MLYGSCRQHLYRLSCDGEIPSWVDFEEGDFDFVCVCGYVSMCVYMWVVNCNSMLSYCCSDAVVREERGIDRQIDRERGI